MSTYTPIASQTLGSAASSVTFSSIPQGYTDLVLVIQGTHTSTGNNWIGLQYNGDTGTTYSSTVVRGDGSSATSSRNTNDNYAGRSIITSAQQSNAIYQIQNYSNSTTYKTCLVRSNGAEVDMSAGLWRNTAAIATVTIVNIGTTFSSGTTFSLYGIAGGQITTKASGGIVTTSGGYAYHTFTSSGRFIPSENLTADILVVAGGGGAGGYLSSGYAASAGGGSGGLLSFSSQSLTASIGYGVTVGGGGAGGYSNTTAPVSGSNSQFGTLTTVIGGGFGSNKYIPSRSVGTGGDGGSGGGGVAGNGGTAVAGQGNNGGGNTGDGSGGGGGAGAAGGSTGTTNNGGNGGIGATSSLINAIGTAVGYAVLSSGNYYLAGGGGGGKYDNGTQGTGGTGGGGAAGNNSSGTSGTANTGGGGGAASYASGQGTVNASGGNGGSGIVIIRYLA